MANPAINATLLAATKGQDVERTIEGRLRKAKAFSPATAIALAPGDIELHRLEEAIAGGTVKRAPDGRVFLDEQRVADRREGRVFMVMLILLVTASVLASVSVLAARSAG